MKTSKTLISLSWLIVVLAFIAAATGVFYQTSANPFQFTTVRGLTVQIYGQGLYYYETPIPALSFKMADVVTLVLGLPALIISLLLYSRGSLKGGLGLSGAIAYILYNYISFGFGAAYNNLFLVYILLLALSLCAQILALFSFDVTALPNRFSQKLPRRGISIYLIVSGVLLTLVWLLMIILPALLKGQAPDEVWSYTTFMTGVLDIGLVAPALIASGLLLFRREPLGYLFAATMLIFTVILGINITLGGIAQVLAGVVSIGQFIGMTVSFTVLTLFALWFAVVLFRNFSDPMELTRMPLQAANTGADC